MCQVILFIMLLLILIGSLYGPAEGRRPDVGKK